MEEQIEHYIAGRLSPEEADQLWEVFLMDSSWYEYFLTELHLKEITRIEKSGWKKNVAVSH